MHCSAHRTLVAASVLVVHVNPAVGGALARRLHGAASVALAPVGAALQGLADGRRHDVVVLCPYLTDRERRSVLAGCSQHDPHAAVLELVDAPGESGAFVHAPALGSPHLGRVLEALATPTP